MLRGISGALGFRKARREPPPMGAGDVTGTTAPECQGATGGTERLPAEPSEAAAPAKPRKGRSVVVPGKVSTIEAHTAAEHAAALLSYLQGPGGRSGTIPAHELEQLHREFCLEADWEVLGWMAVARELRRMLGARKEYARFNGQKLRIWRIPPARSALNPLRSAESPARAA